METLVREPVKVPNSGETDEFSALAADSAKLLGYERAQTDARAMEFRAKLFAVLHELAIDPFTPASVKRYQHAAVKENHDRLDKGEFDEACAVICCFCALLSTLIPVVTVGATGGGMLGFWLFLIPAAFGIAAVDLHIRSMKNNVPRLEWEPYSLRGYHGRIPEFVQQSANDIARRLPDAKFEVEVLVERRRIMRDPFLVVVNPHDTEDRYYVEVWNEPKYKQERMA